MSDTLNFTEGKFVQLRATRSFHIGEIAKKFSGVQSDIREGETIEFDGEFCVFRGEKYKTPGLKGAVKLDWLVTVDSGYETPAVPVVRDEVSRPLGSQKEEPRVVYTGLKLEEYDFNAHWQVRKKMIDQIDDLDVLNTILSKETKKFASHIEKRIAEVESALVKSKRERIGAVPVEGDTATDLLKALDEEVTEISRDQIIQTPTGKKKRKALQRDVMEQNEVSRPTAKKKGGEKKAKTEIGRDDSLIEGNASATRQVSRKKGRANRASRSKSK